MFFLIFKTNNKHCKACHSYVQHFMDPTLRCCWATSIALCPDSAEGKCRIVVVHKGTCNFVMVYKKFVHFVTRQLNEDYFGLTLVEFCNPSALHRLPHTRRKLIYLPKVFFSNLTFSVLRFVQRATFDGSTQP